MTSSETFPQRLRLRKSTEFDRVFARRASVSDHLIVVYACEGVGPQPRIGLVVSRKVGNAVVRNRWKRLFREGFRRLQQQVPAGVDFVVLPCAQRGREHASPELAAITRSLALLTRRAAKKLKPTGSPPA